MMCKSIRRYTNIFRLLEIQDLFTFGNAACGMLSIFFSMRGDFRVAAMLLLAAVVMDYLDGKVARLVTKKPHPFGRELDSLADAVSFGAASAVFGFSYLDASSANSTLSYIAFTFFLLCGIARLARFNITKIEGYEGMPITINGLIIPVIYFAGLCRCYYPYAYLLSALLMISSIRIKKII